MTPPFTFGTKAETLERLCPRLQVGRVLPLTYFSVRQFVDSPETVLEHIHALDSEMVVVRSSALGEDSASESMAGAFDSVLDVPTTDEPALRAAIQQVIDSYNPNPDNQVLVQPMTGSIQMAGVAMTRDLEYGSDYLVINYDDESGKTDSITGGSGTNKTLSIHRSAPDASIHSSRIRSVRHGIMELESIIPDTPLDVEFAIDQQGQLLILQVRPITLAGGWQQEICERVDSALHVVSQHLFTPPAAPGILGKRVLFGDMPDWNPAEMIGTTPAPLAASLYRTLITDSAWAEARARMGYRKIHAPLMSLIVGHPFIDTRASFSSFLPATLEEQIGTRLVNAWTERLTAEPEFHDKVEFEIALTSTDFNTVHHLHARYPGLLNEEDATSFLYQLAQLTTALLDISENGSLAKAEQQINTLAERQKNRATIQEAPALAGLQQKIDETIELGTIPFSILARHGFIAENLLRSAVDRSALSPSRLTAFRRSVPTVGTALIDALHELNDGTLNPAAFTSRFGHLRPGSYDITSRCYRDRPLLTGARTLPQQLAEHPSFTPSKAESEALHALLQEAGLEGVDAKQLFHYARRAIQGREYGKFVFTRNLSEILENIACWGEAKGVPREQLALIDVSTWCGAPSKERVLEMIPTARTDRQTACATRLGALLTSPADLVVIPTPRAAANFVGQNAVQAEVICLDNQDPNPEALTGKLVCIRNADPGYDWIFTGSIAGLITQYGGSNSHMAIRSAEFGLPAAIGCGKQLYERIISAPAAELNCGNRTLVPIDH